VHMPKVLISSLAVVCRHVRADRSSGRLCGNVWRLRRRGRRRPRRRRGRRCQPRALHVHQCHLQLPQCAPYPISTDSLAAPLLTQRRVHSADDPVQADPPAAAHPVFTATQLRAWCRTGAGLTGRCACAWWRARVLPPCATLCCPWGCCCLGGGPAAQLGPLAAGPDNVAAAACLPHALGQGTCLFAGRFCSAGHSGSALHSPAQLMLRPRTAPVSALTGAAGARAQPSARSRSARPWVGGGPPRRAKWGRRRCARPP